MARATGRPGNLPAEATSFVGRRRELAEVRALLGAARVVSVVGPGGVGKTRLAVRAAADLARGFPDGAWLVSLAEVRDPALVDTAAAEALTLQHRAPDGTRALLRSYLADKQMLLVLDNCEHVLDAAAGLVSSVVEAAPGVRVLATSREPLSVSGEHVLPLPPLDLPPVGTEEPLNRIGQNEAVMLLTQRAAAASGEFTLTEANRAAVVGLCRRLDGLPLAIELAAVRTRVLSVEQILAHLTDRFALLTSGSRAALPRHQTLRTAIDWSHDLLDADERIMLRRLGVFAAQFTLEDVQGVCTSEGLPAARVLDVLSSLVDKSLVSAEPAGPVASYRLYETIREYARLRLREAGEDELLGQRHAEYYTTRCRNSAAQAGHLVQWLAWLDLQIDNVRAALQWCVARAEHRTGLVLATSLGEYWVTRATAEGTRWLDQYLTAWPGNTPEHAQAQFLRGFLAVLQADQATATAHLAVAARGARDTAQPQLLAKSLAMASVAANLASDRASGGSLLAQARAAAADLHDPPARLAVLQAEAIDGFARGDLQVFYSASERGAQLSRQTGDLYTLQVWLMNQGFAAMTAGNGPNPEPRLTEALRIAERIDDRVAQFYLVGALGCHAATTGDPQRSATLLGASTNLRAQTGAQLNPILAQLLPHATQTATTALGPAVFDAQYHTGTRLPRDAAIKLALGDPGHPHTENLPTPTPTPLTPREDEVAHLIADGLTNRQIGTRLMISERTVENHVHSIMNKLGINSRAQIASWISTPE